MHDCLPRLEWAGETAARRTGKKEEKINYFSSFLPILRAAVPLAHPSLPITVDEKKKGTACSLAPQGVFWTLRAHGFPLSVLIFGKLQENDRSLFDFQLWTFYGVISVVYKSTDNGKPCAIFFFTAKASKSGNCLHCVIVSHAIRVLVLLSITANHNPRVGAPSLVTRPLLKVSALGEVPGWHKNFTHCNSSSSLIHLYLENWISQRTYEIHTRSCAFMVSVQSKPHPWQWALRFVWFLALQIHPPLPSVKRCMAHADSSGGGGGVRLQVLQFSDDRPGVSWSWMRIVAWSRAASGCFGALFVSGIRHCAHVGL